MTEKTGDNFDVSAIVEDIHGKAMSDAMPADVLFDSARFTHRFIDLQHH